MKVAIATQSLTRIDAHFGWASHLMVYDVSAEGVVWLETRSIPGAAREDGNPAKLQPRLQAVQDCVLIFVADIGVEGAAALLQAGVTPLRHWAGQPLALALDALRDGLRGTPPPWLRKAEQISRRGTDDDMPDQ